MRLGSGLFPAEIIFPGADFKVLLYDAQIDVHIPRHGERGPRFHHVSGVQDEFEFLLVDGSGGEQGYLKPVFEPLRVNVPGIFL